ncbi:tandem-95 repeat protein [Shewanella sp. D64]|uniref:Ig-like domain-containing protein n=1 Tax=unclassified Shewanella TaxID=196818 RepID=UPI0022BA1289|nr:MULTISPECIES: tandem-95 repeat protein [unclassified Shewanella]MEC4729028.1 tandem-95 repeat protein [Shewanella sp. D64]MEC4739897.1 tandem-95 repeat protein [Shewanella sp. E94]WBJ97137.1 tandem-95 repeat protein [Shewanella sp. MTB7]
MKNNKFYFCLMAASLNVALIGCGDNEGLIDKPSPPEPPPVVEYLRAFPQAMILVEGENRQVDLTHSVESVGIATWSLKEVLDTNGLGYISNETNSTFNYLAQMAGVTSLDYEVQGGSKVATSHVLVAVNAKPKDNTVPTAENITLKTGSTQNININLQKYIFDADGDALTIEQLISTSGRFSLAENRYSLTFKPAGYIGVDQAMFSVEDGNGGYAIAYVVISSEDIDPEMPNIAPEASNFLMSIDNTMPVWTLDLLDKPLISDENGDSLRISHVFDGNGRAVEYDDTLIRYTSGSFIGVDQFTYVVTDNRQGYAAGTVTVTVSDKTPANKVPTATEIKVSGELEGDENPLVIDVANYVHDDDGDTLHIIRVLSAKGTVSISPEAPLTVNYTPPSPSQGLIDKFSYVVTDNKGGYAMSTITVNFNAVVSNSAPTASIKNATTLSNEAVIINLDDVIYDAETASTKLAVSNLSAPGSSATATLTNHTITYTPKNFTGVDVLTYTVSDSELSTQGVVVITVTPSDALNAADFTMQIEYDTPVILDWQSQISKTATLFKVEGGVLGTVKVEEGQLTYTPTTGKYGEDKLVYVVKDDHDPVNYAMGVITITILKPPAPEITALAIEGTPTIGSTLTAKVTCDLCTEYQYKWNINGLPVSTLSSYDYQPFNSLHNVTLTVTGIDKVGQQTPENVVEYTISHVESIYSTKGAFAAVKDGNSVIAWGNWDGGDNEPTSIPNLRDIYSNSVAFAAVKTDGSVIAWGRTNSGGEAPTSVTEPDSNVDKIYSNGTAFVAVKTDNSVIAWGSETAGGSGAPISISNLQTIYSNDFAFVAVKIDGSVIAWGHNTNGGNIPEDTDISSVKAIYSTNDSFAALKYNNSVGVWGSQSNGGCTTGGFSYCAPTSVTAPNSNVQAIYSNNGAFAAVKSDGSVVTWGNQNYGGCMGTNNNCAPASVTAPNSNVQAIYSTRYTFSAVKTDGSVVAWGDNDSGGCMGETSNCAPTSVTAPGSDVQKIYSNDNAFLAVKSDGTLVAWGDSQAGGCMGVSDSSSYTCAPESITASGSDIKAIYLTTRAFAAVKTDGSVIAWGSKYNGGTNAPASVTAENSNVKIIHSTGGSFAAVKVDGSVVAWGSNNGGIIGTNEANKLEPSLILIRAQLI